MATKKPKQAGPATRGLQVTAKRASFYRGGQAFGHEPRVVSLADLSEEQADQIRAEGVPGGMLIVSDVEIDSKAA